MLTANYLMNVAEPMVELWSQIECDIIQDISRRIAKNAGQLTETASWQIAKARELGILQSDVADTVAKASAASQKEVRALVLSACEEALAFDDRIYVEAGFKPLPITQSQALMDVVNAGITKTNGLMRNFTNTTATGAVRAFETGLDRAYMQVISGAFSYDEALRTVIRDLARKGIDRVAYPSGSSIHMDAAARRALLTGLNQTTAQLQLARMDELDTHLIETTSHAGARPSHAQWQGGIYWRGKKVSGYENFEDSTGYGTGDGLCGWNCYHSFFPYFEGISQRAYHRSPARLRGKTNDQMYEESQKQRYYERKIRESRRECAAYSAAKDAATDPQAKASLERMFQQASVLLKKREAALNDFCTETNRTKLPDRVMVPAFNRSVSSRAVWANRKAQRGKHGKK